MIPRPPRRADPRGVLAALLLSGIALGLPASGTASPHPAIRGEPGPTLHDFWRPPGPADRRAEHELMDALRMLRKSLHTQLQRVIIRRKGPFRVARAALRKLTRDHPKNVRFWYWRGYAAHLIEDDADTLASWMKVYRLAPEHWSIPDIAFTLGVILAKQGRYAESVRIYQHGMPRSARLSTRGIMASNCAESAMAAGHLKLAERLYRASLRFRPRGNSAAWWGLMVALDRQGLTWASQRAASQALLLDPTLRGLVGSGVFFVPTGDVHYYLALAYEAQGRAKDAIRQWGRFLARRPGSRYTTRARDHRRRLRRIVARYHPRTWLTRVVPPQAAAAIAPLVPRVARCYRRRARRKPIPEGPLSLILRLYQGRIWRVQRGWVPNMILDHPLEQCIERALRNQPLRSKGHPRLFVTFRLELGP